MKQDSHNHFPNDHKSALFYDVNSQSDQILSESFSALQEAYGPVPYGMTNDYMFRAVLQSNNKVLRGLICSL
ncbi:MAG: hypothetical protein K2H37_10630, partial [Lachnospiraceae bacterium]|nr:hypothetical protein [Lachnospiraceae bacterium]